MSDSEFDAVVIGAGFAGMYMLHRLRELGLSVRVFEAGSDVGGTWFWNRYPGARCDIESMYYSYSFSEELEQEWEWTERYATQPEILRYANHVAERFDLRRDIQFDTRVLTADFDEASNRWLITTDHGDRVTTRYCITAVGCLSTAKTPEVDGIERFRGPWYHTGRWPHEGVDFTGQLVGVIGTGSSGIQSIPLIAEQAAHLTVFQRTPNFSLPALNAPLDPQWIEDLKANYRDYREQAKRSRAGVPLPETTELAAEADPRERTARYAAGWGEGTLFGLTRTYADIIIDKGANDTAADFVRDKIREIVHDPVVADKLAPKDYPLGTKRICLDTNYFATFNCDNVELIDVRQSPIVEITETGLRTDDGEYEFDALVFATGFDAMTGPILGIDFRGRNGQSLREKWSAGPRTYLGVTTAEFPNLFMITGPGSPSVLSNMMVSIEQHVDWIAECIEHMRSESLDTIEPIRAAEDFWVDHVNMVSSFTLFPQANSWYMGANVPGKPRVFMPYIGGVGTYRQICDGVVARDYEGLVFDRSADDADPPFEAAAVQDAFAVT